MNNIQSHYICSVSLLNIRPETGSLMLCQLKKALLVQTRLYLLHAVHHCVCTEEGKKIGNAMKSKKVPNFPPSVH